MLSVTKFNVSVVIVLIILCSWVLISFNNTNRDGFLCMRDPFDYGAKRVSELSGEPLHCSCSLGFKSFSFSEGEVLIPSEIISQSNLTYGGIDNG